MPKYELMYILSSAVSDNDAPNTAAEIDKFITDSGGKILASEMMGKKKLAYPIKKTRNGFYILTTFNMDGPKQQALDDKLRSLDSIIRYLVANVDDLDKRRQKDELVQAKMRASRKTPQAPKVPSSTTAVEEVKLTETELEEKIEKALESEDLSK